jgi:hypothetical protein
MKSVSFGLSSIMLVFFLAACSALSNGVYPWSSIPPTPSLTPTSTATETATPTPKPSGPCENILFPLIQGNRWYYQKDSGTDTSSINLLVESVKDNTAQLNFYSASNDLTSQTLAQCQGGAIQNFPASDLGMLFFDTAKGNVQLEYQSGLFFPTEDVFIKAKWDYAWKTELFATGTFNIKDPQSSAIYTGALQKSPVSLVWHTAGAGEKAREAVSVPAGDFPHAIKILLQVTLDLKLQLGPSQGSMVVPAKAILLSTLWFEPYVGLVKEVTDSLDVESLGAKFPQDVHSSLVLKKYSQQK